MSTRTEKQKFVRQPLWYKDAIIYQVHVKSFFDSNNDGIGDFAGMNLKMDYIASLGVNAIWLLPFYPSPRRDDGYDIAGYRDISPDYGTMREFKAFLAAAHERGLKVITELVINHTSDAHPWFQRARLAKPGSNHRDFYVWSDTDQRYLDTRIIFLDTEKSNWTWDPVAGAYFWHRFYSHQPDLNFDNPQVLREVIRVMRFWLDLGVDGLRLDAIPYLVERDGTNNENLPETHAVLKKIRAALDESHPDRMLIAEANQWPEDTSDYFGDGDECHMAFHFPLMPRMYMAIAKEDRFPITDIMRQTPAIPDNAQWAIFLRNHDELTLEMVTDEERDYLWNTYAADRRARINLGIRRRLAPLMQRDRRRIELMNALLLSMPGTPVIYYGDEIGMGDNIHLGDRDGVRTPMQWSPDRNGGFSRADPAQQVLPPIMDPLYGFQAVNVEAQSADPHSLLNWMRKILVLRRDQPAFGRGTLRFLYPSNRKVFAYLREFEDDTILCVANMSRAPQAAELDLSAFAGRVPIEMTGPTPFPPIGQLSYLLTLPPYGFFWFRLVSDADAPAWRQSPPEQMPEFTTLVMRSRLTEIMDPPRLVQLEREILPAYLQIRRWFAAKDEKIEAVKVAYALPLPGADDLLLAEVEARVGGRDERYVLPLAIVPEETPSPLPRLLALARVRRGRRVGLLTDAFATEPFAHAVLSGLRSGLVLETADGTVEFRAMPAVEELEIAADAPVHFISAEQSNSSLIVDDQVMLKVIRHVSAGIHPETEMTRHLTEVGYANSAPLVGEVVRVAADGTPHTLAVVQGAIRNQGDAWTWLIEGLKRALQEVTPNDEEDTHADDAVTVLETFVGVIGTRLGELHRALSAPSDDPAFAPEPATAAAVKSWRDDAAREVEAAVAILAGVAGLPEAAEAAAKAIVADAKALKATIARPASVKGLRLHRIHGDFHLGQVLVAKDDAYIIDFEGEPARPLEARRAKSSGLRDVAGLLRSLDYVAATVTTSDEVVSGEDLRQRQVAFVERFLDRATAAFLAGYRGGLGDDGHELETGLLDLFLIEKAAYEVRYEAANRPKWLPIPIAGLAKLSSGFASSKGSSA